MRLSSLLSVAFAAVLFTACSAGASSGVAPTNSGINTPSPSAAATAAQLVIPSPTMPFVRCDTADLEMQLIKEGAAAGNIGGLIEVRNKSSRDCDLYGFAGLELLDSQGNPLPTKVVWSTTSFFLAAPAVEEVVGLPAATVPITADRPVPGHAYIPVSWDDVLEPCSDAARLKVTPPDSTTSLVITAMPPAGTPSLMLVCSGGTLVVNPTRAAEAF
jgi:hypothetical protein